MQRTNKNRPETHSSKMNSSRHSIWNKLKLDSHPFKLISDIMLERSTSVHPNDLQRGYSLPCLSRIDYSYELPTGELSFVPYSKRTKLRNARRINFHSMEES